MLNDHHKPIILISGSTTDSKSVTAIMAMVRSQGAEPMLVTDHLHHGKEHVAADLAKADGVIIMGNNADIAPERYGEQNTGKTKSEESTPEGKARAEYEYALLEQTLTQKVPYLGICGGMQRLNVHCHGSLHQHVPDLFATETDTAGHAVIEDNRHAQPINEIAPYIPVQQIKVDADTRLARIAQSIDTVFAPSHTPLPRDVFMDNSMHHQAVKNVGAGLCASAHSVEPDRPDLHIIEAIEASPDGPYKDQFVLGVQWHPEFGASEMSAKILGAFSQAAHEYCQSHPKARTHDISMEQTTQSVESEKRSKLAESYRPAPDSWAAYITNRAAQTTPALPGPFK